MSTVTTVALALPFGLAVGASLGALGGGGSILTVPVLVYVLGESPKRATAASLVIVGIAALWGMTAHARAHRVRWRAGAVFGVVGVGGSLLGTALNRHVDGNVLLLAFALLMVVAASVMLARQRASAVPPDAGRGIDTPVAEVGTGRAGTPVGVATQPATARAATELRAEARTGVRVVVVGSVVGFMTGFFGVGGGFVIVPGLVLALGFAMPEAVGTSLLVIAINSTAALIERAGSATFSWSVIVPFTIAAMAGSLVGNRAASAYRPETLARAFAYLLVAVALYVGTRSISALA